DQEPPAPGQTLHLVESLRMPRRQYEPEVLGRWAYREERVKHRGLLAAVRAARHHHRRLPQVQEPAPELLGASLARRHLHLEVAGHEHLLRARAQADDAPGVLIRLHAEEGDVVEDAPEQAADEAVASVGAVGDAAVGEDGGHLRPAERPKEVGPELRLERDEASRL